jgi:hypothetical protein
MYKIPKEEEIRKAIYRTLKKHGSFSSLNKLRKGILEELKRMNEKYTISIPRARVLTARSGFVKIRVKKKHERKELNECPVCRGRLKYIKNLSLTGKEVVVGYRCELCSYKGARNEAPLRYLFHFSGRGD